MTPNVGKLVFSNKKLTENIIKNYLSNFKTNPVERKTTIKLKYNSTLACFIFVKNVDNIF